MRWRVLAGGPARRPARRCPPDAAGGASAPPPAAPAAPAPPRAADLENPYAPLFGSARSRADLKRPTENHK